jgi:hypothetical protein
VSALAFDLHRPEILAGPSGGLTLEDLVLDVWEGLAASRSASCPVCGGDMLTRRGAGPELLGGDCCDCGSSLA